MIITEIDKEETTDEKDFFSDFEDDVQKFPQPEISVEQDGDQNQTALKVVKKVNHLGAKTLVGTMDGLLALALSLYALSDKEDEYKLSEQQQADISELLSSAMPSSKQVIPDWLMIVLGLSTIYGSKFRVASKERSVNQKAQNIEHAKYEKELNQIETSENGTKSRQAD